MHAFPSGLISRCTQCGNRVRYKVQGRWLYGASTNGPWEQDAGECSPPPAEDSWLEHEIVFFDLETTGLDWRKSLITEVGFARGHVVDGKAVIHETFTSLVYVPRKERESEEAAQALSLTGIKAADLGMAPSFPFVCEQVSKFLERASKGALLASFNSRFDVPFLSSAYLRFGLDLPELLLKDPVLDPLTWSRAADKFVAGGHKLTTVAVRRGVADPEEIAGAHRADFDAALGLRVLASLAPHVPRELDELHYWQMEMHGAWEANLFGYIGRERKAERLARRASEMGMGAANLPEED